MLLNPPPVKKNISLKQYIHKVVNGSLLKTTEDKIYVTCQIDAGIELRTDDNRILDMVKQLVNDTLCNLRDSDVFISAEKDRNAIVLLIEERNKLSGLSLSYSMGWLN